VVRSLVLGMLLLAVSPSPSPAAEDLIAGGDFERGIEGWAQLWTRTPGGRAAVDTVVRHGGRQSVRVEHTGTQDWSLAQTRRLGVQPGQIFELGGWVRLAGDGNATLAVVLWNAQGEAIDWSFGGQTTRSTAKWRRLRSRFVIPPGAVQIQARLIGHGPATVWLDDVSLVAAGRLENLRAENLPKTLAVSNAALELTLDTADATLSVLDRRTQHRYAQRPAARPPAFVLDARPAERGFDLRLLDPGGMLQVAASVRLDARRPEIVVELAADGEMAQPLAFPHAFAAEPGGLLIMPVNEGISYPVDDQTLRPMYYHLYGGHGLCMGFWGMTDARARAALLAIVETPDDAAVRVPRLDGRLCLAPEWVPQKGRFGPPRRIRYVLFDDGGYVAMAKRYRQHAKAAGLLRTLADKREENPNVDLLVGAVNVWCWDREPAAICRELKEAGIDRILWSNQARPEQIRRMNDLGVLTSRYDIYQDVMDPAHFPKLRWVHSDWTTEGWPKDLCIRADGQWERGWQVEAKDGPMVPCGVLCDRQAVAYAQRRIPAELKTHPYRCRFIDTTTASPWRECYDSGHPMTRTESRKFKMDLLGYVSHDCKLVAGSETGHEAAVPYVHYFEGMLSLGPYRVPDSGRDMMRLWDDVPERVATFQTGHKYRLPLWELVYHDCVVAQWYWGDYNNKLPALWERRDLWNALYGTPPMFMFDRPRWEKNRERFARSYRTSAPIARATGYNEMLSHQWLTEDHAVQRTRFAGGASVTVNLGLEPYRMPDGMMLEPLQHRVEGIER
jgi:hypothetical protein